MDVNKIINIRDVISTSIIICLLSSCASIPSRKVDLKKIPEITSNDIKKIDLSYRYNELQQDIPNYKKFDNHVGNKIRLGAYKINLYQESKPTSCFIEISTNIHIPLVGVAVTNYIVSFATLFLVPSYRQTIYQAKVKLISKKDNKVLKTYELKDKIHEIWSSLWMLSWFVVKPSKYSPNAEHPKEAVKNMKNTISEALVRQVIHDANQFPECQKQ